MLDRAVHGLRIDGANGSHAIVESPKTPLAIDIWGSCHPSCFGGLNRRKMVEL